MRFDVRGEPLKVGTCHCLSCRKASGAAYVSYADWAADRFSFTGETRTFNGRVFKIEEHVERLYRSLKYLRIDPGLSSGQMIEISEEVSERNRHLLGPGEDHWVGQRISRGVHRQDGQLLIVLDVDRILAID